MMTLPQRHANRAARATPPPVRKKPAPHAAEHHHAYHPRSSNHGVIFGILVAVGAVAVVALMALVNREDPPSFNQLKAELGLTSSEPAKPRELDVAELTRRLEQLGTELDGESFGGGYVFLYYGVKEGTAEIIVERGPWELGTARIRRVSLR